MPKAKCNLIADEIYEKFPMKECGGCYYFETDDFGSSVCKAYFANGKSKEEKASC